MHVPYIYKYPAFVVGILNLLVSITENYFIIPFGLYTVSSYLKGIGDFSKARTVVAWSLLSLIYSSVLFLFFPYKESQHFRQEFSD
jgi:hypothetical protein